MIAMQYSFTLPADYDMSVIDRRIRDKGPLLDGFPNLGFKAYLSALKGEFGSRDNLYAPFYLWQEPEGASDFLCGPAFQTLTGAFGWPQVRTWIVWQAEISPDVAAARFATRDVLRIEPYAPLTEIRRADSAEAAADVATGGALASASGFEPTTWTRVRFRLWREIPEIDAHTQAYRVGHLSLARP
ncbi:MULTISPECIES: DUF4865 family protein [unclassified Rhizobium]|uniref:DUF4865 family protein n=1 Tax=unclassified Rhizobium TaxID=2613769 RepID=UPI001C83A7DC|nr:MULTISPECIES: DUF4865 family protein [unclassified Rhizobium]MBX5158597.1 DUF4865 family protein [Rhizobium sp. NZLR8]MBX5163999.1 DUF4865 family protein [Rhizobium sp. NZLR4b]MBX5171538.1 DUF4865 family protein [Rhizobium sp. NZLR1b]MBX5183602.1 DUF4865 family protein [Rhizobium sp. NZLR5]MBX5192112.1 DUF4865 family protein [Rhizobium sp. NZLR3b]